MKKIALLCLIVASMACNSRKHNLQDLPDEYIELGSFGGFTGAKTSYFIFKNGNTYHIESLSNDTMAIILDKKQVREQFKALSKLSLDSIRSAEPGNMNYYLNFTRKDKTYNYLWQNKEQTDQDLIAVYTQLTQLISTHEK